MRHLSVDGLFELFAHHPLAKVLDVRFHFERDTKPIPGVHHVPWFTPDWEPNPVFLDQVREGLSSDDHVLVICQNGQLSCQAAALLEKFGFRHVYNVLGGFEDIKAGGHSHGFDVLFSGVPSGGIIHEQART